MVARPPPTGYWWLAPVSRAQRWPMDGRRGPIYRAPRSGAAHAASRTPHSTPASSSMERLLHPGRPPHRRTDRLSFSLDYQYLPHRPPGQHHGHLQHQRQQRRASGQPGLQSLRHPALHQGGHGHQQRLHRAVQRLRDRVRLLPRALL